MAEQRDGVALDAPAGRFGKLAEGVVKQNGVEDLNTDDGSVYVHVPFGDKPLMWSINPKDDLSPDDQGGTVLWWSAALPRRIPARTHPTADRSAAHLGAVTPE